MVAGEVGLKTEKLTCPQCGRLFAHPAHMARHDKDTHQKPAWGQARRRRREYRLRRNADTQAKASAASSV